MSLLLQGFNSPVAHYTLPISQRYKPIWTRFNVIASDFFMSEAWL